MNITVIGTGYVGLVTGACLAETGNSVTCLDIDKERMNQLSKGNIPFYEPSLKELVLKNFQINKLKFSTSYEEGCKNNIFIICVGTPDKGDGTPDLSSLQSVLDSLVNSIKEDSYIFTKSTVPLGTNEMMSEFLNKNIEDSKVVVSSNPEFLKEGSAVNDFQRPDRIIVGSEDDKAKDIITELFQPFSRSKNKMQYMSVASAELSKYASNSFLATKISFMNEMALICEKTGADINEVRLGIGSDPRIGESFLYAGLGYGGSCFPKDINALIKTQKDLGIEPGLLERTKSVNERQVGFFLEKILSKYSNLSDKHLTIWGLSFKPNSDDVRESIAIKLINKLSPLVENIRIYDPVAGENALKEIKNIKNITNFNDKYEALNDSDGLIICTEWKEFWDPNPSEFNIMKNKTIFDGRNILNKIRMQKSEIEYYGIGT